MNNQAYYELYRQSSIGSALTDSLDQLISESQISPQLAMKILSNFDRIIAEALSKYVEHNMTFKGHLDTYRFCDEVWTFLLTNVTLKFQGGKEQTTTPKLKIVSCATLVKKPGDA